MNQMNRGFTPLEIGCRRQPSAAFGVLSLTGFTLTELLIGICLLAVIVLGLSSINLFTNFQVMSSDRRAKLQNEASLALEHMAKNLSQAIGDKNNLPYQFYADNLGIRVRIDNNPINGKVDSGDGWIGYKHTANQITFCPSVTLPGESCSVTPEVISNRIVSGTELLPGFPAASWGLKIEIPVNPSDSNSLINEFDITVKARWDPTVVASVDNPEVILKTTVLAPAVSVK